MKPCTRCKIRLTEISQNDFQPDLCLVCRELVRGLHVKLRGATVVKPNPDGDSPLTPWGEQLARVQQMCTEGYGGLSGRDKDDIRAVYHRMLDLTRDSTSTDQDTELHE